MQGSFLQCYLMAKFAISILSQKQYEICGKSQLKSYSISHCQFITKILACKYDVNEKHMLFHCYYISFTELC